MEPYEIDELADCARGEKYFIRTHFKTENPFGFSTINIDGKQSNLLDRIDGARVIYDRIVERQIGASTMFAAHALWLAVFQPYQRIVIVCPKNKDAKAMRKLVKDGFNAMPDFLKPKVITDHARSLEFDNGSWIHYTNSNAINLRGFNATLVILDSFESYKEEYKKDHRKYTPWQWSPTVELLKV